MDKSKILTSNAPVAREVKFSDGTTETVHFRQVSAGQMRRWRAAEASGNEDETCFAMQRLVAASLCDADGKLVLSEVESQNLTANGLTDLFPHVMAVAGIGEDAKKSSPSVDASTSAAS
ncbi:phage tail assembly chaperone family protein, TAC [uncultured Stenotrophomonas sp.]|uniref:phage tail assembly chaperone family protein, TAC n=1 Tax=uncultured Stenotrophomonas sp. TaxID=165438 RepID=UPI002583C27A|nr:phage tail assembly chaperone family protein, TAC [uncultured Stenotrophomonas sp.]